MGIAVLVPDVNRSAVRVHARPRPADGTGGHRRSGWPPCAMWARAWSSGSLPSAKPRARSPTLRLLPARRPGRPQQADHGVAGQGRGLRLHGPPPPGPVPRVRRDRRSDARAARGARLGHRHPVLVGRAGRGGGDAGRWEGTRVPIPEREFDKAQRLAFEKEMLGLYVSDHPLMGPRGGAGPSHRLHARRPAGQRGEATAAHRRGHRALVGGVVTDLQRQYTKKGDLMARFVLEDLQASMEVFVFPRVMADYGALLEDDAIVVRAGAGGPARRCSPRSSAWRCAAPTSSVGGPASSHRPPARRPDRRRSTT